MTFFGTYELKAAVQIAEALNKITAEMPDFAIEAHEFVVTSLFEDDPTGIVVRPMSCGTYAVEVLSTDELHETVQ